MSDATFPSIEIVIAVATVVVKGGGFINRDENDIKYSRSDGLVLVKRGDQNERMRQQLRQYLCAYCGNCGNCVPVRVMPEGPEILFLPSS